MAKPVRDKMLAVYLSPKEYKKLEELADSEGLSVSAYCRRVIMCSQDNIVDRAA